MFSLEKNNFNHLTWDMLNFLIEFSLFSHKIRKWDFDEFLKIFLFLKFFFLIDFSVRSHWVLFSVRSHFFLKWDSYMGGSTLKSLKFQNDNENFGQNENQMESWNRSGYLIFWQEESSIKLTTIVEKIQVKLLQYDFWSWYFIV